MPDVLREANWDCRNDSVIYLQHVRDPVQPQR